MYSGNYSRISVVLGESRDISLPLTAALNQSCLAHVAVFWLYWLFCWPRPRYVANHLVPSSFLLVPLAHDWILWWDYAILESTLREAAFHWWCSASSSVALNVFPGGAAETFVILLGRVSQILSYLLLSAHSCLVPITCISPGDLCLM